MLKEGKKKKSLRRREECKTMPTCVSVCVLLSRRFIGMLSRAFLALLPSRAESARITARDGNVGNSDLECFHRKFYRSSFSSFSPSHFELYILPRKALQKNFTEHISNRFALEFDNFYKRYN